MRHRLSFLILLLAGTIGVTAPTRAQSEEADRLREATLVLQELKDAPDVAVPRAILDKAVAIAVFPSVKKGGLVVGGHFGRGVISARSPKSGSWSAPAFLTLTGGSVGLQIGGQAIDLVLVVMDQRGLEQLLKNQFKIGGDASVAAGPVGRDAEAATDIQMRARILSYSRTRGLFAGVTLKGSTIRQDRDANERFYGRPYRSREILIDRLGGIPDPVPAWRAELER
ncbi:MAG TPA: lipid-binding SYLF domain-containing protein [Vicinamibacterales bacterium]